MHKHTYRCSHCPECGSRLTDGDAVVIVYSAGGDERHTTIESYLDEVNLTLQDVNGIVAKGLHVDTECRNCGESLCNEEVFDDL